MSEKKKGQWNVNIYTHEHLYAPALGYVKVLKMIETSLFNFNTEKAANKVMPLLGHKKSFPRFSGR